MTMELGGGRSVPDGLSGYAPSPAVSAVPATIPSAMPGTKMLRRRDVLHAVNHLIRSAHLDRDERLADGNQVVALIIQRKIAAYYQALQVLNGMPVFINASAIEAAAAGETRSGSTEGESAGPQDDAQPSRSEPL